MTHPEVSVIIVNYNHFNLLENCLSSLIEKTSGVDHEIIVVDNGSTEGNVDEIISNFPSVILIKNSVNKGFSAANNQGAGAARGRYLLILNNDTVVTANSIKIVYDFASSQSEEVIVGIKLLNKDGSMQESVYDYTTIWNSFTENFFLYKIFPRSQLFNKYYQNYYDYTDAVEAGVVKGAFLFISKKSFEKLNGFDERFFFFGEELDLCYRFNKQIGKIFYYPLTSIIHIGGAATEKDPWFKYKNQTTAKIQFYQKHFKGISFALGIFFHFSGLAMRSVFYFLGGIFTLNKNLLRKSYYFLKQIFVYPKNQFK